MRTLAYDGPTLVHVHGAAGAGGAEPVDAIAQITATRIWAADHPWHEGRRDYAEGALVRHESLADVLEVGDGPSGAGVGVGDVLYLRLTVACGICANCEMRLPEYCLTAQPGPSGTGAPDVTAPGWSVGGPELDNAWQRVTRLLHDHPAGLHSAPLSRAVFSQIGSDGSCPEETPTDYRHFNRWDDAWVSVLLPRRPG
jgi:threonine dehydrogenase-like Zn-dependent dehydrogenase